MMLTGRKSKNCLPKNANGWLIKCRSIFVRSMRCSMMNAKGFGSGTRNTMKPILVTMCNISSGSSASLVSSFSAWLSSCYSIAITTGRSNLMLTYPSVVELNLPNMACGIHSGNNRPTDNRHFCWKSVGLLVLLLILIRWIIVITSKSISLMCSIALYISLVSYWHLRHPQKDSW